MPKVKNETNEKRLIPVWVWIFFGCSLLMFCIALYESCMRPKMISETQKWATEEDIIVNIDSSETPISEPSNTESSITVVEEATTGPQFLYQWYQIFSSKDVALLKTLMDSAMRNNATIKQFWSAYKINSFIDGIENHSLQPQNITLISTSPSWIEEYQYELEYSLLPEYNAQHFKETRVAKVRYTETGPQLASLRCETPRCSYNPFFRPENYGLVK